MYFDTNQVIISDAQSDVRPTKLTAAYDVGSTASISVQDASEFCKSGSHCLCYTWPRYMNLDDWCHGPRHT